MKIQYKLALPVLVALLCACSGIKVEQDYDAKRDFSRLKNYAWQSDKQKATGDVRVDNSLLSSRIRQAIDDNLAGKFKKSTRQNADFLVAYHYVIREKEERDRVHTGFGIGTGGRGSYGGVQIGLGSRERDYEDGELTVDAIDPATNQLIWRGVASRKIVSESDPAKRTARINETVQAILKKFPPR
jgi:hypothetical protein